MMKLIHVVRWYIYITYWWLLGHRIAHRRHHPHGHAGFRDTLAGRF